MVDFEFATATRIIFGAGSLGRAGSTIREMGRRVLVVRGVSSELTSVLEDGLHQAGVEFVFFEVSNEPTVGMVREGIQVAKREGCDCVIGFGGGSAVDTGKAIAVLLTNPGELDDYLEVVGKGYSLLQPPVPYLAIPTTAGTGAEVTRNAVLGVPEKRVKISLRSPLMLPRLAIVDPQLTYHLPPEITAYTGLDALTQLVEPFVSNKANPMTDPFCREGMQRAARSLRRAYERGDDTWAREDMCLASLFGGLALANAGLGAVHGFAGPLGGMFPAPHGAVCARLLPLVMEANILALRERAPGGAFIRRYDEVAQILSGDPGAVAEDGVAWAKELAAALNVPGLSAYGLGVDDLPELIEKSAQASSMRGNPIQLTPTEMRKILIDAL